MVDRDQTQLTLPASVLRWLRAGYPEGIPPQDYLPILGVLRRRLTSEEIHSIATDLAQQASTTDRAISHEDIESMIEQVSYQDAGQADVSRVSARLAAGGWPLADPHEG